MSCSNNNYFMKPDCEPPQERWKKWLEDLPVRGRQWGLRIIESGGEIEEVAFSGGGSYNINGEFVTRRMKGNYRYKLVYSFDHGEGRKSTIFRLYDKISS